MKYFRFFSCKNTNIIASLQFKIKHIVIFKQLMIYIIHGMIALFAAVGMVTSLVGAGLAPAPNGVCENPIDVSTTLET